MDERFLQVAALIAAQPPLIESASSADRMRRLCVAAASALDAAGVGVTVVANGQLQGLSAASDSQAEQLEELQFTMGEGPCIEAFTQRRPVLVPDLDAAAGSRWPGYVRAVHTHGVRAVFAFPLQIGAARLGVLDVFRGRPGMLGEHEFALAFTFADVAMTTLLNEYKPADSDDLGKEDLLGSRAEVFQAQGMVTAQLGVSLADALATMRAHAYLYDRRLSDVAADIVIGKLRLEPL